MSSFSMFSGRAVNTANAANPAQARAEFRPNGQHGNGIGNGNGNGNGNGHNGHGNHSAAAALFELAFSPQAGADLRRVGPNEVAWDADRDAGKILFVREGLLRVYHGLTEGRQRLVRLVGPGGWTAVEALAAANGARTRIVAAETSAVALVDANRFIQLALTDHSAGRELIRQLARQSVNLNAQVTEATLLDCEAQLVHSLLRLAKGGAGERDPNGRVTLRLTQQDLADSLGIARETANGMLQRLAEQNLIAKRRGRISFEVAQLEKWAHQVDATARKDAPNAH